ncbi:hypothetical protein B0H16DRAFT_1463629 [Mycena metata]|uniref:Uncharacterized protein n=1 Tax=Mycena metata TaxID=1033252 RepID=A0AAD7II60_9AGAR|nr:hypothetical protein B0H16DRAFT_1463629 [Mycena metata]
MGSVKPVSPDKVNQTTQNVTHRHLASLVIGGYIPDEMPWNFLNIFTLPALQKLESRPGFLQGDFIGLLQSLISRSRCSIQELYIPYSPESSLELYLLALPTVGSIVGGIPDPVNPCADAELVNLKYKRLEGIWCPLVPGRVPAP